MLTNFILKSVLLTAVNYVEIKRGKEKMRNKIIKFIVKHGKLNSRNNFLKNVFNYSLMSMNRLVLFYLIFMHFLIECIIFISSKLYYSSTRLDSTHKLTEFSFQMENLHCNDFISAPDVHSHVPTFCRYNSLSTIIIDLINFNWWSNLMWWFFPISR